MKPKTVVVLIAMLAWPLAGWPIGFIYVGTGGNSREIMELSKTTVEVQIQDRVAVTRTDQIFTSYSTRQVEGIYEFKLPPESIITDLVLWIEDVPVQAIVMEKEAGRQLYDEVVGRRVDPALVEQLDEETFRLSIFPFPPQGSRRVELEYMQLLKVYNGALLYSFPLVPETDLRVRLKRFALRAEVRGQHPLAVESRGELQPLIEIEQADEHLARIVVADDELVPEQNLDLHIHVDNPDGLPTVLSVPPVDTGSTDFRDMGYYALWLPPLQELARADLLPRSLIFLIDISSSMQGQRLKAVKEALMSAIRGLQDDDLFNVVVFGSQALTFSESPIPASAANKEKVADFIDGQIALGVTNFEAAFRTALGQRMLVVVDNRAYSLDPGSLPRSPVLSQNRPNPFNASTLIILHIPADMETTGARLVIYNLLGQRIREFPLESLHTGDNEVKWEGLDSNGQPAATDVYIYRLEGLKTGVSRRMLLLR